MDSAKVSELLSSELKKCRLSSMQAMAPLVNVSFSCCKFLGVKNEIQDRLEETGMQ